MSQHEDLDLETTTPAATTKTKYIRKDTVLSISLPKDLLAVIDSLCEVHKIKRSQLIRILLVQEVEKNAAKAMNEMTARLQDKDHEPSEEYLAEVDGKSRLAYANEVLANMGLSEEGEGEE
jgi:metal-responsive CopG/Arc/MetJ family transcriptional regulator